VKRVAARLDWLAFAAARRVALAVSAGRSNRRVSNQKAISEATVRTNLSNIFSKLDVSDRVGLVLLLKRNQIGFKKSACQIVKQVPIF
jgi:DNA-binding CsgD family transcriptional regulator